jgi:hypothetical protein
METIANQLGVPTAKRSEDSCASIQTKSLRPQNSKQAKILQSRPLSTTVKMIGAADIDGAHNMSGQAGSMLN